MREATATKGLAIDSITVGRIGHMYVGTAILAGAAHFPAWVISVDGDSGKVVRVSRSDDLNPPEPRS